MTDCWACCVSSGAALLACHEVHTTDRDGRKSLASSSHKAFSGNRFARKPSRPAPPAGPASFPTSASERNVAHVNNLRGNRTAEFSRQRAGHMSPRTFSTCSEPPSCFTRPRRRSLSRPREIQVLVCQQRGNQTTARLQDTQTQDGEPSVLVIRVERIRPAQQKRVCVSAASGVPADS